MFNFIIGTDVDNFLFYVGLDNMFFSMKYNKIDKKPSFLV